MILAEEKMKTTIINFENALENESVYAFLCEMFNTSDIDVLSDSMFQLFEGDPDMLKLNGETVLFTDIKYRGEQFVIYLDGSYIVDNEEIERMLSVFYTDEYQLSFDSIEGGWDAFHDGMIAYRGGAGYSYSIWKYIASNRNVA